MLPAANRLRKDAEVKRVLASGHKQKYGPLLVFSLPADGPTRLAVVVSKKVSKLATRRNYLRRLVTELIRTELAPLDFKGEAVIHLLYDPTDPVNQLRSALLQWRARW